MPDTSLQFFYYVPQKQNLAINEVLYNPQSGGNEFIELYNLSQNAINLKDVYLNQYSTANELKSLIQISDSTKTLNSGEYIILTKDSSGVQKFYDTPEHASWLINTKLPTLSNEGTLVIKNIHNQIIDSIKYDDNWQFAFLTNTKGVSLERLNPALEALNEGNWQSAAETAGWATPGALNSQYSENTADTVSLISLSSQNFSPDNDGHEDRLTTNYHLDENGYQLIAKVMDANGKVVAQIANNELLGTQGEIYWDGILHDGSLIKPGIYVIFFKFFKQDGSIKTERKVITVNHKF